ncbi:hypothetical protein ABIC20_002552 [Methylobacterium radiotolerans]|uniref:Uncharacterized protein n=1 Tax=Methylobacterium radiotolerans TaxID=31998 RepID=A0ABV2NFG0_9HYPH
MNRALTKGVPSPAMVGDLDGEVAVVAQRRADLVDVVGLGGRTLEEPAVATDDLVDPVIREVEEGAVGEDDGVVVLVGIREDHRQAGLVDGGEQHVGIRYRRVVTPAERFCAVSGPLASLRPKAQDLCLKFLAREAMQIVVHLKLRPPPGE